MHALLMEGKVKMQDSDLKDREKENKCVLIVGQNGIKKMYFVCNEQDFKKCKFGTDACKRRPMVRVDVLDDKHALMFNCNKPTEYFECVIENAKEDIWWEVQR